jgi:branched-chain amino acid transport system substrate-binding protein
MSAGGRQAMAMRHRLGYGPAAKEFGMKAFPAAAMLACVLLLGAGAARAENAPGVTATGIKLGQTMSYSGPVAEIAGPLGESEQAYFRMIDDQGGVNGRRIVLESLDDGFDAQKALDLTKKMIEQDHVAAIFGAFATPQNVAIEPYLNARGIPDLFIATGDDWVINPKKYPWTIGGIPVFRIEAQIFGRYILVNMAGKKVGLLRSRDQMGDSYRAGLGQGLGAQYYQTIAKEETVDDGTTDIDPEWQALRAAGVDAVVVAAPPAIVARAIAKAHDGDWHPQLFINFASSSGTVLAMAGFDKAVGIMTANSYLDPSDPRWQGTDTAKPFLDFVAKYLPHAAKKNVGYFLAGYVSAQAMVQVLKQCGDDLSRLNIMRQATNLKDFHPVGLIPGITFFTSRTKYLPIVEAAMQRWDGHHWVQVGEVMAGF